MAIEAPDILTETAVRQAGAAGQDVSALYQSTRSAASVLSGAFTVGARADRTAAVGEADGDRWKESDTGWLYYYSSGWHYESGLYSATDAQRAALTVSADDNGAWLLTTDTDLLWQVAAGAWVLRGVTATGVRETSGPTELALGAVADGQFLKRSGSTVVGDTPAAGTALPAADTTEIVKGSADATKLLRFEVDGFTTGTTRVVTPPDADTRLPVATQTLTFSGPTAARTVTLPDANISVARTDAAQTFTGNQTFSGNLLSNVDGASVIGSAAANRFGMYAYGFNLGNTGAISAGFAKLFATTNGIQMQSGFLQLGSGVGLGWSSGDVFSVAEDLRIKRAKAAVLDINAASATVGGTLRAIARTAAQITANQNDYNPGGVSLFQRWSSDASRNVTGLSISQVDGEIHFIVNVGTQNIVLVNESASSTAANRFITGTGADITLAPDDTAQIIYDSTSQRWRVL